MCIYSTRICVLCRHVSGGRAGLTKRILSNHRCDRAMNRNERCSHLRRGPTYSVYRCRNCSHQRHLRREREVQEATQTRLDQTRAKQLLEHLRGESEHAAIEEDRQERRWRLQDLRWQGQRLHHFVSDDPLSMSLQEREIWRRAPPAFQRAFQEMLRRQEEIDRTGREITAVDLRFRWSNLVYHFERSEGSQFDIRNRSSPFGASDEAQLEQDLRYPESPESSESPEQSFGRFIEHIDNFTGFPNQGSSPDPTTTNEHPFRGSQNQELQYFEPLEPGEREPASFAEMVDNLTPQAPERLDMAPEERLQNLVDEYGGFIGNEFPATYLFNWRDTIESVILNTSNWNFTPEPEPTSQIQEPGTEALAFRAWFEQQHGQTVRDAQESWHWEFGLRYLEALTQYTEYLRGAAPQTIEALMAAREVEVENRLRQLRGERRG